MAGGLSHIVGDDGKLTFAFVENGGDRIEALISVYNVLAHLIECGVVSAEDLGRACDAVKTPVPDAMPVVTGVEILPFGWKFV